MAPVRLHCREPVSSAMFSRFGASAFQHCERQKALCRGCAPRRLRDLTYVKRQPSKPTMITFSNHCLARRRLPGNRRIVGYADTPWCRCHHGCHGRGGGRHGRRSRGSGPNVTQCRCRGTADDVPMPIVPVCKKRTVHRSHGASVPYSVPNHFS